MKQPARLPALLVALTLVAIQGCASTTTHEGAGDYVNDAIITTKVKAAIFREPSLDSTEIKVETVKGAVQLSGFVSSRLNITKALLVASGVSGVRSVQDEMRVR